LAKASTNLVCSFDEMLPVENITPNTWLCPVQHSHVGSQAGNQVGFHVLFQAGTQLPAGCIVDLQCNTRRSTLSPNQYKCLMTSGLIKRRMIKPHSGCV
jgi:hypothetical protein